MVTSGPCRKSKCSSAFKVCTPARPCCPPASGTSPRRTRRSRCCRWASARTPPYRTALGGAWPVCVRRRTSWPVRHPVVVAVVRRRRRVRRREVSVDVGLMAGFYKVLCPLTWTASLNETSPMELREGYSLPSFRSCSVTSWARACCHEVGETNRQGHLFPPQDVKNCLRQSRTWNLLKFMSQIQLWPNTNRKESVSNDKMQNCSTGLHPQ